MTHSLNQTVGSSMNIYNILIQILFVDQRQYIRNLTPTLHFPSHKA